MWGCGREGGGREREGRGKGGGREGEGRGELIPSSSSFSLPLIPFRTSNLLLWSIFLPNPIACCSKNNFCINIFYSTHMMTPTTTTTMTMTAATAITTMSGIRIPATIPPTPLDTCPDVTCPAVTGPGVTCPGVTTMTGDNMECCHHTLVPRSPPNFTSTTFTLPAAQSSRMPTYIRLLLCHPCEIVY